MSKALAFAGGILFLVLTGCGGDDEAEKPAGNPGTANPRAATSTTTSAITALQVAIKPSSGGTNSGQASANQLSGAAQSAQSLVTAAPAGTAGIASVASALEILADPPGGVTGSCECTETSCTFKACGTAQVVMDGTYSWGGGHIEAKGLTYTIKAGGGGAIADVKINLDCDLNVTDTTIKGTFRSKGDTTSSLGTATYSSSWDTSIQFNDVTFPKGGGAPTAGSEHVEGSVSTTVAGIAQTYVASFDVTFPAKD